MSFIKSKLTAINNNMKNTFKTLLFISLMCGVLGADEIKTVMEGDSVTLQTDDTEILTYNLILWRFEGVGIAEITDEGEIELYEDVADGRFRGRLKLDQQTGSLTITNTRTNHSGVYKTEISTSSTGTMEKSFTVIVYDFPPVIDPGRSEVKSVSVIEGGSVTLNTDIKPHGDELIVWRFGDILIAKDDKENNKTSFYPDERFKERIQLDQTGSLIIRDSRTADTGEYKLKISSSNRETKHKRFSLFVRDSGLSAGAIAGITVGVLLIVAAAVAAGVIYYRRRISELERLKERAVFMMKGESVPLITDDDHIKRVNVNVYHGETLIAEIRRGKITPVKDEIRERLKLDHYTGSLFITNTRRTDTGLYILKTINRTREITYKRINVTFRGGVISNTVMKGNSVYLNSDVTELQKDADVVWRFKTTVIADKKQNDETISLHQDALDGKFRGRLKVDQQTGSLTITNNRMDQSGTYELKITSSRVNVHQIFSVSVIERAVFMMKGESVTLITGDDHIKTDDVNMYHGETLIAEIRRGKITPVKDEFRERLKLDDQTGSLFITNTRSTDTGLYILKLIISTEEITYKRINVTVRGEGVLKPVKKGDSFDLNSDATELQKDADVVWRFDNTDIAGKKQTDETISLRQDALDGKFKQKLQVDQRTGSLTITNIRMDQSGKYELKINSSRVTVHRIFSVIVFDAVISNTVMKGDSVYLNSDVTELQKDADVVWRFKNTVIKDTVIADNKQNDKTISLHQDALDDDFKQNLLVDQQTGSLSITNIRTDQFGDYELNITSSRVNVHQIFSVTVYGGVISKTVMKGDSVDLKSDVTELQKDADVVWRFETTDIENTVIADKKQNDKTISLHQDALDGKFKQNLLVNKQTGSLSITNIRTDQFGDYELNINSSRVTVHKIIKVTVYDPSGSVTPTLPRGKVKELDSLINIESADGVNESDGLMNNDADVGVNEKQGTSSV